MLQGGPTWKLALAPEPTPPPWGKESALASVLVLGELGASWLLGSPGRCASQGHGPFGSFVKFSSPSGLFCCGTVGLGHAHQKPLSWGAPAPGGLPGRTRNMTFSCFSRLQLLSDLIRSDCLNKWRRGEVQNNPKPIKSKNHFYFSYCQSYPARLRVPASPSSCTPLVLCLHLSVFSPLPHLSPAQPRLCSEAGDA